MSWPGMQGWHISIYVTVAILVIQFAVDQALKRFHTARDTETPPPEPSPAAVQDQITAKRLRLWILVVLGTIAVPLFTISFLGPTLADQLAGATGTGLGGLALWLAWQTHKESQRLADYLEKLTDVSARRSETGTRSP